jgi:YD repeat-containing protein
VRARPISAGGRAHHLQYFYDDLGQLIKVIDSTGIAIEYVDDPVGNILEIKRSTLEESGHLRLYAEARASGGIGQDRRAGVSADPLGEMSRFT